MRNNLLYVLLFISFSFSGYSLFKHEQLSEEPKVTNLFETELDRQFTPDREVRVDLVELPPGGRLERHWHPGEEFHYYLEGDVEIRIDVDSSIMGKAGKVGHVPFKRLHEAVAGPQGAKVLVFRVHTKGEPWRYKD